MRTTLESGAWVEHPALSELKGKHKRALDRAGKPDVNMDAIGDDGDVNVRELLAGIDMLSIPAAKTDALWAMLITSWSYDLPVPELDMAAGIVSHADSFDELPLEDYAAIEQVLAPYDAKLNRRPDPKGSTTSASNGSSPGRRAHGSRQG